MAKMYQKQYPIKYLRLYTSKKDNKIALSLYDKIMDIKEPYQNENDVNYDNKCLIYSKSLNDQPVKLWNNKFINLRKIIEDEKIGRDMFIKNN